LAPAGRVTREGEVHDIPHGDGTPAEPLLHPHRGEGGEGRQGQQGQQEENLIAHPVNLAVGGLQQALDGLVD